MKRWVRFTLIGAASITVMIGMTRFGVRSWARSKGMQEIRAGGAQNLEKGFAHLELAHAYGDPEAGKEVAEDQCKLGMHYFQGDGLTQDSFKAAFWFKKSAALENANGQNMLGICYKYGEGVPKDYVAAFLSFKKAAEQGLPVAQYNLGLDYQEGVNFQKDLGSALTWYRKAAEQGYSPAQKALADPEILQFVQTEQAKQTNQVSERQGKEYSLDDIAELIDNDKLDSINGQTISITGKLEWKIVHNAYFKLPGFRILKVDQAGPLDDFMPGSRITVTCYRVSGFDSWDSDTKMATFFFFGQGMPKSAY